MIFHPKFQLPLATATNKPGGNEIFLLFLFLLEFVILNFDADADDDW